MNEGLSKFVSLKHSYFLDLVRAFLLCGLNKEPNGVLNSEVRDRRIVLTPDVWMEVTGLQHDGEQFKPKNPASLEFYDRNEALFPFLKDPSVPTPKKAPVSLLIHEGRLLHYAIVKIIYPRKGNFATLLEEDILLMFCFKNGIRINWPRLLKCKAKKNGDIPYAVLISAFLDRFWIKVDSPRMSVISEFDSTALAQMKIQKIKGSH